MRALYLVIALALSASANQLRASCNMDDLKALTRPGESPMYDKASITRFYRCFKELQGNPDLSASAKKNIDQTLASLSQLWDDTPIEGSNWTKRACWNDNPKDKVKATPEDEGDHTYSAPYDKTQSAYNIGTRRMECGKFVMAARVTASTALSAIKLGGGAAAAAPAPKGGASTATVKSLSSSKSTVTLPRGSVGTKHK